MTVDTNSTAKDEDWYVAGPLMVLTAVAFMIGGGLTYATRDYEPLSAVAGIAVVAWFAYVEWRCT